MSETYPYYTLTIHIAEGGTPIKIPNNREGDEDKVVLWTGETSKPGHMWFSLQKVEGPDPDQKTVNSFGFAPEDSKGPLNLYVSGKVFETDSKTYHQPLYTRTMEITEAQYKAGMQYAQDVMDGKSKYPEIFKSSVEFAGKELEKMGFKSAFLKDFAQTLQAKGPYPYHGIFENCVEFTWNGLEQMGFKPAFLKGFAQTPRGNIDEVDSLPPVLDSPHNQIRRGLSAEEVRAGLRQDLAGVFRGNPEAALARFPVYAPVHEAYKTLEKVSEKYAGTPRGDALVKMVHNRLANALERGSSITNPQQMLGIVRSMEEALEAVSEKYAGTPRGDALVKEVHNRLANALEHGSSSIPNPQQMLGLVHMLEGRGRDLGR